MLPKLQLAQSYWPRTGCDQANRSRAEIPGPDHGNILVEVQLPHFHKEVDYHSAGGCVVTDTMTLRVAYDRFLSAITLAGEILWSVEFSDTVKAFPVALQGGGCLGVYGDTLYVYSDCGKCLFEYEFKDEMLDDSGVSPNLTDSGHLIIGCTGGEIIRIDTADVCNRESFDYKILTPEDEDIDGFGYDIITPAIHYDDSLTIAGYYGTGFCRTDLEGKNIWNTDFAEPDLVPTINRWEVSAVGSLNEGKSAFFSSEGELRGTYDRAAIFAEYSPRSWIARSNKYLARLDLTGEVCWGYKLHDNLNSGYCQPIVDSRRRIYLVDDDKLLCFNGQGEIVFAQDINGSSCGGLSCISPGKLAFVGGGKLKIIG